MLAILPHALPSPVFSLWAPTVTSLPGYLLSVLHKSAKGAALSETALTPLRQNRSNPWCPSTLHLLQPSSLDTVYSLWPFLGPEFCEERGSALFISVSPAPSTRPWSHMVVADHVHRGGGCKMSQ